MFGEALVVVKRIVGGPSCVAVIGVLVHPTNACPHWSAGEGGEGS